MFCPFYRHASTEINKKRKVRFDRQRNDKSDDATKCLLIASDMAWKIGE